MNIQPIILGIVFGIVYFAIWVFYRLARWRKYNRYRAEHLAEHNRRAIYDNNLEENHEIKPEEVYRRTLWNAVNGPLASALELKNHEENRWPVGSAVQGATSLTVSIIIAFLIFGSSLPSNQSTQTSEEPITALRSTPTILDTNPNSSIPMLWFTTGIFLVSGIAFWILSKSRLGKTIGATLVFAAPLISGLKLITIEKFTVDKIFSGDLKVDVKATQNPLVSKNSTVTANSITRLTHNLALPPFESGSAEPNERLYSAINSAANTIASDTTISLVILVGRADRRELLPHVRRKYASNWGLAQQRAACVQQALIAKTISASKILVTTAGPLYTQQTASPLLLEHDRSVSVLIYGGGERLELGPEIQDERSGSFILAN